MTKYFQQKVVWITGASSGIGAALAFAFSSGGARLILSSRRTDELERIKAACAHPEDITVLSMDLTDIASLAGCAARAIRCYGHIDVMVHNGGMSQRSLAAETALDVHRRVMELDYFSYVELTHALLPHFIERQAGHFVVMSSVMGKIGTPMRSGYAAAKHALHGYFDCLRAEVAPAHIKVTVLTPGYIRTQIAYNALKGDGSPRHIPSHNINKGLDPDTAARRILRVVEHGKVESYIGKWSGERLALWLARAAPRLLIRLAPKLTPK